MKVFGNQKQNILNFANYILLVLMVGFSILGVFQIVSRYLNNFNQEELKPITFEDKSPPEIEVAFIEKDYYLNHAVAVIRSREDIQINGVDRQIQFSHQSNRENYYELIFPLSKEGKSDFEFNVTDLENNNVSIQLNANKVLLYDQSISLDYVEPFENSKIIKVDDSNIIYVSPDFRLPADYKPNDLVDLNQFGINNINGGFLKKEAGENLFKMQEEMKREGINMYVTSAFRPFQQQTYTYNFISSNEGIKSAESKAARPGYSEHQLGLAVDIVNEETNFRLPTPFQKTRLYNWLESNAHKYGFVKTYDGSDMRISEELWHWRYVGTDHATNIFNGNQTPFEYLKENVK